MPAMRARPWALLALSLMAFHALSHAQSADDLDALALADRTQERPANIPAAIQAYVEIGAIAIDSTDGRHAGSALTGALIWEQPLSERATFVLSTRYDTAYHVFPSQQSQSTNTVRELYTDLKIGQGWSLQTGRINIRQGVAIGFNPTDYFKDQAVRASRSPDPDSLKTHRQGSVVLAPQRAWESGVATLFLSPKLATHRTDQTFALDAGATNDKARALLTLSQRTLGEFRPQISVLAEEAQAPQYGLNATTLYDDQTVLFAESSAGRSHAAIETSLNMPGRTRWRNRLAVGATYTTSQKLSLTAEYYINGAGATAEQWADLRRQGSRALQTVLTDAQSHQDPPSQRNWFFHASWKDIGTPGLHLSAFARASQADRSRQYWMDIGYQFASHHEIYVQRLLHTGQPGSVYGSVPASDTTSLFYRYDL